MGTNGWPHGDGGPNQTERNWLTRLTSIVPRVLDTVTTQWVLGTVTMTNTPIAVVVGVVGVVVVIEVDASFHF